MTLVFVENKNGYFFVITAVTIDCYKKRVVNGTNIQIHERFLLFFF